MKSRPVAEDASHVTGAGGLQKQKIIRGGRGDFSSIFGGGGFR